MKTKWRGWFKNEVFLTIWASTAAFMCYFSVYAFRKPFTAANYAGLSVWEIDYKIVLVIAQVLGYMLSKFAGIKIISEMKSQNRPLSIFYLLSFAALSLLLFAYIPAPYNIICLFFNGLPLGLLWGIVFSYLEGRRQTEAMGVGLAVSFIVSSGVCKSIGKTLISDYNVSEFMMPIATAAFFILPLIVSVWMLAQIPPPSVLDEKMRSKRVPMTAAMRYNLFTRYAFGIVILTAFYLMLTAFRDFRDNFIVEIWADLGHKDASILTTAELPIALAVLFFIGLTAWIKDNPLAFWVNHLIILMGCIIIYSSTYLYENQVITPVTWMILVGFGLYSAYILFQSLIFERMLSTFKEVGNVGFLMYVADAFGYLGSVGVLLFKNFGARSMAWATFFKTSSYILSLSGMVLVSISLVYFYQKHSYYKTPIK